MRKFLLLVASVELLLATNGTNLIGTSTVSRSLGGTGVAHFTNGVEALHKNIALMGDVKKSDFQFDLTYFSANVTSGVYDKMPLNANLPSSNLPNLPSYDAKTYAKSQPMIDTSFIPSVGYVSRYNDHIVFGFGMIGAAGMAANYKGEMAQRQLKSSMMLMKLVPAISYRQNNTTFGFAPVIGLGSMSLNYDEAYLDPNGNPYPYGTKPQSNRQGLFGTNIGGDKLVPSLGFEAGFDVKVTPNFRFGGSYKSSLKYTYKNVANFSQFGPNGMVYMADEWVRNNVPQLHNVGLNPNQGLSEQLQSAGMSQLAANAIEALAGTSTIQDALAATNPNHLDDLTLEQPWEMAIGFSYQLNEEMLLTADYRYIAWGLAQGYKDFGWKNQNVLAAGLEFDLDGVRMRMGYNYADSPIEDVSGEEGAFLTDVQGHYVFDQALSMLNMVGFPAISTTHFTFGLGWDMSDDITLDTAVVYSPTSTVTRKGALSPLQTGLDAVDFAYEYETKMEQLSISFGLNIRM